jgi:hypothetical protein
VMSLGKLPWFKWAARGQCFDDLWFGYSSRKYSRRWQMGDRESVGVSLELTIRKVFAYEPGERVTMTELVELYG